MSKNDDFINFFNAITNGVDPDFQRDLRGKYLRATKCDPNKCMVMKLTKASYNAHKADYDYFEKSNNVAIKVITK